MNRALSLPLSLVPVLSLLSYGCAVEGESAEVDEVEVEIVEPMISGDAAPDMADGPLETKQGVEIRDGLDIDANGAVDWVHGPRSVGVEEVLVGIGVPPGPAVIPGGAGKVGGFEDGNGQCSFGQMLILEVPLPEPSIGWPAGWEVLGGKQQYCVKAKNVRGWLAENYECGYHYEVHPLPMALTVATIKAYDAECAEEMRASQE